MNECLNRLSDERLLETELLLRRRKQRLDTELTRLTLISKCYKQLSQTNSKTNRNQLMLNLIALKSQKSCDILLSRIDQNQHVMDITGDYHMNECLKIDNKTIAKDLEEKSVCYADSTNNCIETAKDSDEDRNNNENYNNLTVTKFVFDTISSANESVIDNNSNISRAVSFLSNDKCGAKDGNNSYSRQKQTNTGYSATDEIIAESILEKWLSANKTNTENSRPSLKWRPLIKRKRGRPHKLIAKQKRVTV